MKMLIFLETSPDGDKILLKDHTPENEELLREKFETESEDIPPNNEEDNIVFGIVETDKSFGSGAMGEWFGIDIIETTFE